MGLKLWPSLFREVQFLKGLRKSWSLDLRSLAAFRICLGVLVVLDLINRSQDLVAHYTDYGVLPRSAMLNEFYRYYYLSLQFINGGGWFQFLIFAISGLCALLLIIGYRTRLMVFLSWLLMLSLQARNPVVLQGGDIEFRLLFFWAIFLPLGARYSIDRALDPRNEKPVDAHFSMGSIAFIIQIISIYFFAALLKTGAEWHISHTAIYYALSLDQFATEFGKYLLNFPDLLRVVTLPVWYLELLGGFLLIVPFFQNWTRMLAILSFVALHLGFAVTMKLGLFPWICITAFVALLPGSLWNYFDKRFSHPLTHKIYYDADCGFCRKVLKILRCFLCLESVPYAKAQDHPKALTAMTKENSWVVEDHNLNYHFRFDGILLLLRSSPVGSWKASFWALKPFHFLGDHAYRWIANHRKLMGLFTRSLRERKPGYQAGRWLQMSALYFMICCMWWNWKIYDSYSPMPELMQKVSLYLRLDQKWNMFAPYPLKIDGWYVFPGKLRDGKDVDVFRYIMDGETQTTTYDRPASIVDTYPRQRWRKYMMNIRKKDFQKHRLFLGKYICRIWNDNHSDHDKLESFDMIFMEERTQVSGDSSPVVKTNLWHHWCFEKIEQN